MLSKLSAREARGSGLTEGNGLGERGGGGGHGTIGGSYESGRGLPSCRVRAALSTLGVVAAC
jgi:hypothetical protein